jgi:polar amino acid transport system permease protein
MVPATAEMDDQRQVESDDPVIVPKRHYGRWISAVVALGILVAIGISLYQNPNIDHGTISHYMFAAPILDGLRVTVSLAVASMIVATVLGTVLGLMRLSKNPVLSTISVFYVWVFRAVPLLVQILVWGNFALLFPRINIGIPFTDWTLASYDSNSVLTVYVAAIIGFGLHEAAYMAEIVRAGVMSVDEGQRDAAQCLGMGRLRILRHIVLPQAMRFIIPPTGNQFISVIKATSLVYVIAGGDLLTSAQNISATNLRVLELLLVASVWYLILVSLASWGQHHLEQHFGRGATRDAPKKLRERLVRNLGLR